MTSHIEIMAFMERIERSSIGYIITSLDCVAETLKILHPYVDIQDIQ
jgi:hypothetical protein